MWQRNHIIAEVFQQPCHIKFEHSSRNTGFFSQVLHVSDNAIDLLVLTSQLESAELQDKRVVNSQNIVNLMLFGGVHENVQLAPGACQGTLMFPLLGQEEQPHHLCWKQF